MFELVQYLSYHIQSEELGLSAELQEVCTGIICVAVPLMVLCVVLFCVALAIMSAFNFLRGRKRDI